MTLPVEQQAQALVDDIDRQLGEQRRALLDKAESEADDIRRRARVKSRERMRRAIQEMRAVERERTQQVRAEIETALRRQASVRAQQALALAWPQLAEAIERRWHDPQARADWIAAQLAIASTRLPAPDWVVRHPQRWQPPDVAGLHQALQSAGVSGATLRPDAALHAGLVVEVGGAQLDSTPAALLGARPRVEAALLATLEPIADSGRAP